MWLCRSKCFTFKPIISASWCWWLPPPMPPTKRPIPSSLSMIASLNAKGHLHCWWLSRFSWLPVQLSWGLRASPLLCCFADRFIKIFRLPTLSVPPVHVAIGSTKDGVQLIICLLILQLSIIIIIIINDDSSYTIIIISIYSIIFITCASWQCCVGGRGGRGARSAAGRRRRQGVNCQQPALYLYV